MSQSSASPKTPLLSDSVYKKLKYSATLILPAVAALYVSLAQIWHFPKVEEVAGSVAAVNTFLGILIQISKKSYYASGAQYVGEIRVVDDGTTKTASLAVKDSLDPEDILNMDEATFKIKNPGSTSTGGGS